MNTTPNTNAPTATISDEMDRLEILIGRIGMNSPEQTKMLLHGLDLVFERMQALENLQKQKEYKAHFEGMVAKLHREAGQALRDLGGTAALRSERLHINPPADHTWWFLDEYLAEKRKAAVRRSGTMAVMAVLLLVLLGTIYQVFLAPPPELTARLRHEQTARDQMMNGNPERALQEVEQALGYAPDDAELLIIKGTIQEALGEENAAQASYSQAEKQLPSIEFLVIRGQAYSEAGFFDKALSDARSAIAKDPDYTEAHLLEGQVLEILKQYRAALASYDAAFQKAQAAGQTELAAIARTRTAMVMQLLSSQIDFPPTETPAP